MKEEEETIRRVLLELSIDLEGNIDVHLDKEMPPLTVLAVIASLDTLKDELKHVVSWGAQMSKLKLYFRLPAIDFDELIKKPKKKKKKED